MTDLVSIIVPIYNMEKSLMSSISSLLLQDYYNIEIILIDDGSTDASFDICKTLASRDNRVIVQHTVNQGSGSARNFGIKLSKGKYLYFPDADDKLESTAISILVSSMNHGENDLVVFGYQCRTHKNEIIFEKKYLNFSNTGDIIRYNYEDYFNMQNCFSIQGAPWNKFFDGDKIRENNILFPLLKRHQDEGFISRYMCYSKNVVFIPEVLYIYYQNTIQHEWRKYPLDYVESVIGLHKIWNETICSWNKDDFKTHLLVKKEILSKSIKVLELSFSPRMKLNFFTRKYWLKEMCRKLHISRFGLFEADSLYQKSLLVLSKIHSYSIMSFLLKLSVIKRQINQ